MASGSSSPMYIIIVPSSPPFFLLSSYPIASNFPEIAFSLTAFHSMNSTLFMAVTCSYSFSYFSLSSFTLSSIAVFVTSGASSISFFSSGYLVFLGRVFSDCLSILRGSKPVFISVTLMVSYSSASSCFLGAAFLSPASG